MKLKAYEREILVREVELIIDANQKKNAAVGGDLQHYNTLERDVLWALFCSVKAMLEDEAGAENET